MSHVVVRFAPSPTGYLHIGGARTAIFNWLYARKHNGKFILRIEDTDADRSTADAIDGILNGLKWLGLDWDEGPYFQSDFIDEHRAAAQQLLNSGTAYKCFCTKSALEQKREQARKNKMTYRYDGTCRGLSENQIAKKEAEGNAFTIRFKVPRQEGGVAFEDAVYGPIEKQFADIEDFIIVRANGQPLYVLSNAVDDIRDGITHIIRGQDGLSNTPKQVLLYKALGASLPRFAHMSLTLDPQKAKISKRKHGEQVAVHYYREKGFLPWAMVNFLVLLGWATSDSREIFSPQELIEAFNLKGIGRTNSVFNIKAEADELVTDPKLRSINSHYLRTMPLEELIPYVETQLKQTKI
jgi:glutamyl-tRNA synthetase